MWVLKRNEQKQMSNFKVNKAATTYNNGETWEVVDVRRSEVVKVFLKGQDAAHYVRYAEQQLAEAKRQWAEWEV